MAPFGHGDAEYEGQGPPPGAPCGSDTIEGTTYADANDAGRPSDAAHLSSDASTNAVADSDTTIADAGDSASLAHGMPEYRDFDMLGSASANAPLAQPDDASDGDSEGDQSAAREGEAQDAEQEEDHEGELSTADSADFDNSFDSNEAFSRCRSS